MGQSSNIYALVKADGKYYVASKEVKGDARRCGGDEKLRKKIMANPMRIRANAVGDSTEVKGS
jgi:hypothetical protein